mgnify:FL=1
MSDFKITDEKNVERDATLLTVIEVDEKEYVIYSIDRDEENVNIFVSELKKDSNGNEIIVDIEDENEKIKLNEIVRNIIKLPL